jgi:phage terminase large subunit-like protein
MTTVLDSPPSTPASSTPDPLGCQACGWAPVAGTLWPSHGAVAVEWIQDNCICAEGDFYGERMVLRLDQQRFLWRWYEYCPRCDQWRYDEALRGEATGGGKTTFIAAVVVLEFAGPPQIAVSSPNIPIAAASFEQADLLFGTVATMCGGQDQAAKESPLCGFFEVYDTEIKFTDGRPGRIFRIAAVAGTNEGGLPTLFVRDELHEWGEVGSKRARVATVVGKSTRKRRTKHGSGRIISLSTAGFDVKRSFLGALYKMGKRAERNPAVSPRFLMDWREAPDGLDYKLAKHREKAVVAASGAAGVLWAVNDRVSDWGKPAWPPHEWIRYYANRWVDLPEDSWLVDHPAAWGECVGTWESDPANPFVVAVDMALKHDSVAVVRVEQLPDGRLAVTARIWRPDGDTQIDHLDVFTYAKDLAVGSGFRGVVYDPRFFEVPARLLEDAGILAIQFDQSPQRMAPACGLTFDLIIRHVIVHDGDPDLDEHVKHAAKRVQDRGFTLSKGKSKQQIDATIGMCMGVWVLHEVPELQQFFASWR